MNKLLRPFGQPWLLSLLGITALAVMVWVLGPSLAFDGRAFLEPPWARAVAVLAIFALWGLNRARVYALARYRSRRLQAELQQPAADPAPAAARANVEEIQAKFADALQALKKHLGRRFGGRYLYELPWYIIMGRSRSGKTTALANAGLNFFRKTPGSGETRDCDWFLTSEAVLLDTAGHLATQDRQQAVDSATWQGFLRLVRKYRPRRPINGVLVAVSAADLLELADAERGALAQTLKERLHELHEGLGIRFPVYVLVTQCDRIAGFMEFFAKLGARERAQIWGMTLPLYERLDTPTQRLMDDFNDHFAALEQRLREQLLPRLHAERRDQVRDLIFAFPQQFGALRPRLEEFLHQLFQPNLRRETPLLRGVYFTSGTQVGSPIYQVSAALAGVFGISRQALPAFSGPGKSYFITGLLREVVFAEAGLANTNLRLERYRRWLHRTAAAAAAAAAVLLGVAWGISYQNNTGYVAAVDRAVQTVQERAGALPPDAADVLAVLPLLDAAWDIPGGYGERGVPRPWGRGFGLDQAPKLGAQGAVPAYQKLLDAALKPRLQRLLETGLMQDRTADLATLKTYLLLGGEHFDAEGGAIVDWWSRHPRSADPDWRAMTRHVQALVDYLAGHDGRFITLDEAVVRRARGRLDRLDPGAWLYGEWRRTCLEGGVAAFDLGQAVGRDNALVFTSARTPFVLEERVPGCFTRDGYAAFYPTADTVEALRRQYWVLAAGSGGGDEGTRLTRQVQRLYLQDYAGQWRDLLENLAISQLSSADLERSVGIVRILANPETSPLLKLLEAVVGQTSLTPPAAGGAAPAAPPDPLVAEVLDPQFAGLRRTVDEDTRTQLLALLEQLHSHLDAFARIREDRSGTLLVEARRKAGEAIRKLDNFAGFQPQPLGRWLAALAKDSANIVSDNLYDRLNDLWNGLWADEVLPFCRQAIAGRYPLDPSSPRWVTLDDFGEFFGPGGRMDAFFQNRLKEFVDTSQRPWRWYPQQGLEQPAISAEALRQFQRADAVRQAFFADGGKRPAVRFALKPYEASRDVKKVVLSLGSQQIDYSHDNVPPRSLQWPDPADTGEVSIAFELFDAGLAPRRSMDGPWAWFRLLEQAELRPLGNTQQYRVIFRINASEVEYELRPSSVFNPFDLLVNNELARFSCPGRL